jgi:hypothetical protein
VPELARADASFDKLVDAGTHTELLARGCRYADLYERQFRTNPPCARRPPAPEPVLAPA